MTPRPNRMGRPIKYEMKASEIIQFRATPEMKARWKQAADAQGVKLSEFLIEAANAFITSRR